MYFVGKLYAVASVTMGMFPYGLMTLLYTYTPGTLLVEIYHQLMAWSIRLILKSYTIHLYFIGIN